MFYSPTLGRIKDVNKIHIDGVIIHGKCKECGGAGCNNCSNLGAGLFVISVNDLINVIKNKNVNNETKN